MGRFAKNLIFTAFIISVFSIADLPTVSGGDEDFEKYDKFQIARKNFMHSSSERNSEFWSKFRESVMPDDSKKNKIPDYEKDPPPERNMPGPPPNR